MREKRVHIIQNGPLSKLKHPSSVSGRNSVRAMKLCCTKRKLSDSEGQASIEYAFILAAFLVLFVALGVFWRSLESGLFVEHALASASHHISKVLLGVVGDVFLY